MRPPRPYTNSPISTTCASWWCITPARTTADATMHVTGREVDERALAIHREYPIGWVLQDESPDERRLSQQGRAVIKALERIGEPCGPSSVARLLGLNVNNTTKLMWTMSERGQIRLVARGLYTIAETVGKDGKDGKDEMETSQILTARRRSRPRAVRIRGA